MKQERRSRNFRTAEEVLEAYGFKMYKDFWLETHFKIDDKLSNERCISNIIKKILVDDEATQLEFAKNGIEESIAILISENQIRYEDKIEIKLAKLIKEALGK